MSGWAGFVSAFGINMSIMLALMYVASLAYKYGIYRLPDVWKEALFVILAIGAGWATMRYGFRFTGTVLFDLRYVAVIVAPMFVRRPLSIVAIGVGIGLARLTFGINHAAIVGCLNVIVMSLLCVAIVHWAARRRLRRATKMTVIIVAINTMNVLFIAAFGVIPAAEYLRTVAPSSFGLGLLLSFLFMLVVREFMSEARRQQKLRVYNTRLEREYRISAEKTEALQTAKRELEEKNEQLMLASKYKSAFLANMSHELRTPLNSILVLSQLLEENAEEGLSREEQRLYAGIIHTSGQELLRLIDEVLDLTKIEAGHMSIDKVEFSLSDMLHDVERMFAPIAAGRGIELVVRRGADVPDSLFTDAQRLRQIMNNLLANALKFTDEGTVELSIYPAPPDPLSGSGARLSFTVRDTGIGIPAEKQDIVFEAFRQADGTTSRKYGGTGLGLAISKQFAELLGGCIELESREGEGSRFTLYLPWEEATLGRAFPAEAGRT